MPDFEAWHDDAPPPPDPGPARRLPRISMRWIMRGLGAIVILLVLAIAWLAITAPLSQSLKPPTPPSITLTAADGTPIARRGAIIAEPVDAAKLPPHVREAFLAIEDRRFYSHWGIDPRGIARAAWANLGSGGVRQGGSTITQQLAKNAFLDSDRTAARKIREVMIAFWLEAWLSKNEILSRYLSNVYFGDNVYGLRAGMSPDTMVDDSPVEIAGWKPKNDDNRYLGEITLRRAFQRSSNVVAARLTQEVGVRNVIRAARDLGISTPIANEATIGLGTSEVSLLELTSAFASVAEGRYPVQPHGLPDVRDKSWYSSLTGGQKTMPDRIHDDMLTLLAASVRGTGRAAALAVDAYGKTGTSQSGRDAWFIGFAGDLVVGVWVGNDDNTPNPGLHGGGIPAQIWRNFMTGALDLAPVAKAPVVEDVDPEAGLVGVVEKEIDPIAGRLDGLGMDLEIGPDGSVTINRPPPPPPPVRRREELEPEFEEGPPPGF